ncbi:MAG TPA: hypothetical protein TECP_01023 [Hyphomicrobiaceae bacterium MAG_BT-2024]
MTLSKQKFLNERKLEKLSGSLRNKLIPILILAVIFSLVTYVAFYAVEPLYSSEARLVLKVKSTHVQGLSDISQKKLLNAHVDKLQSSNILLAVAHTLEPSEKQKFLLNNSEPNNVIENPINGRVVGAIRNRLKVYAAPGDSYISINMQSYSKEFAVNFVDNLASMYSEALANYVVHSNQQAKDNLQIDKLRADIKVIKDQISEVRKKHSYYSSSESLGFDKDRIKKLNERLQIITIKRDATRSQWAAVQAIIESDEIKYFNKKKLSKVILKLMLQYDDVKSQIIEARTLFTAVHPIIRTLKADLERIRDLILEQVKKTKVKLQKELEKANREIKSLHNKIDLLALERASSDNIKIKLETMQKNFRSKRLKLTHLEQKYKNYKTITVPNDIPITAKIISSGEENITSISPPKFVYTIFTMLATFTFGIAVVLAKEAVSGYEYKLSQPKAFNAIVSKICPWNNLFRINSKYAEMQETYLGICADLNADGNKVITSIGNIIIERSKNTSNYRTVITGDHQVIDASREGILLAQFLGRANLKVAIIDLNTKGEVGADQCGVVSKAGIFDLLKNSAHFKDLVSSVPGGEFDYISTGNNSEFDDPDLDIVGFNAIIDALHEIYDHIIIMGSFNTTQKLLYVVKGCLDTLIVVTRNTTGSELIEYGMDTFAGFDVSKIDVMSCLKREPAKSYEDIKTL